MSQANGFIPSPQVGSHNDEVFGTHHAKDAALLLKTLNINLNLFSSAIKINSQYMHVLHFSLILKNKTTIDKIINKLKLNEYIATTIKDNACEIFSFGRDHGHFGRILNQTVISLPSLHLRNGTELTGFCFTPQDGNSLLSSVAATCWFLNSKDYLEKIKCLSPFLFNEV